jgi:hypothetical protein
LRGAGPESDDFRGGYISGWRSGGAPTVRTANFEPVQDRTYVGTADYQRFGSAHGAMFQAGFADGSVRSIRYSVSLGVFMDVCRRNDGNVLNVNDL